MGNNGVQWVNNCFFYGYYFVLFIVMDMDMGINLILWIWICVCGYVELWIWGVCGYGKISYISVLLSDLELRAWISAEYFCDLFKCKIFHINLPCISVFPISGLLLN